MGVWTSVSICNVMGYSLVGTPMIDYTQKSILIFHTCNTASAHHVETRAYQSEHKLIQLTYGVGEGGRGELI